jgi:gluconolactonase
VLDRVEVLATGLDHPEGVAWSPDGRVIAGGEAGQVYAIRDGEPTELGTTGGFLFGVTVDGAGGVLACDFGRARVSRLGPDGTVADVTEGTAEHPMAMPNFAVLDDAGACYVTDSGQWGSDDGCIFVVRDGVTTVWTDAVPAFPNGACLTAEGDALLVVESRARRIVRMPILDDGSAGEPVTVADVTGTQPDGIALAADGTMFVGCYRPDRVWRIPPGGEPEVFLDDPDGVVLNQPANVAFIGEDLDRLAISSLGGWSISVIDPGVAGLALRYPAPG